MNEHGRSKLAPLRNLYREHVALIGSTLVALLMVSCATTRDGDPRVDVQRSADVGARARLPIGALLDPEVFRHHEVQTESTGSYIEIDDMRFPVDSAKRLAFKGHQWPNGLFLYDLAPDVRANTFRASQFVAGCKLLTASSG